MNNNIFKLIVILGFAFVVSCEKDEPTISPEPEPQKYWRVWDYGSKMPENKKSELIDVPCWEGRRYPAKMENGKIIVKDNSIGYDGAEAGLVFKFLPDRYLTYVIVIYTHKHSDSLEFSVGEIAREWSRLEFLSLENNELAFVYKSSKKYEEGGKIDVYIVSPGTQERYELIKSHVEWQDNEVPE